MVSDNDKKRAGAHALGLRRLARRPELVEVLAAKRILPCGNDVRSSTDHKVGDT